MTAPANENRRIGPPRMPVDAFTGIGSERFSGHAASSPPPEPAPKKRPSAVLPALRAFAGAILVLGTSVGAAWAARSFITTTPRFAVTDISVLGGKRLRPDDVRRIASLEEGINIFTVDLDTARARLLEDPWVKEVEIARRLPSALIVQITEREASAIVALPETYLVSRDGEVIKRYEAGDPADLPIVTGLTLDALQSDREAATRLLTQAIDVAVEYERTSLASRAPLQEVHLGGDGSVRLVVGKQGIVLALGEGPFRRKLEQATRVFAELEKQSAKADAILLDNEARPDRVVVRMR